MKLDLVDGEKILLECYQSPIWAIFCFLFACFWGIATFSAKGSMPESELVVVGSFICLFLVSFIIAAICIALEAAFTKYIITNKRVIINKTMIFTKSSELNLNKIESDSVNEGLFGIFGVGTVSTTGTGVSTFIFKNVPNFKKFKETLVKARDEFNLSKNTPVNNVVVQQRSKVDELKELKALLDSGALTQEEFDIEKQKILSKN